MARKNYYFLGKDFPRKDGAARAMGKEVYPSDIFLPGMWYGKVLRSPYPHAVIRNIDFTKAEKSGAVCLSYKDVRKKYFNQRQVSIPESTYLDWQILSDKVRQVGDAYAVIAAETKEILAEAAGAVEVEWEILPSYLTPEDAMKAKDNLIHDKFYIKDKEFRVKNNIACTREIVEGDVETGFKEADVIIENEFVTPRVYHCQLEPRSCVCRPEPDGGITVWPSTQALHNTRILLGELFNLPLNKLNVVRIPGGGHFGSGIQTNSVIYHTVAVALKADKPVKIVMSREDDLYDHCRYPVKYTLKIGAKKDGTLVAGELRAIVDIGCHHIQAFAFLGVLVGWWRSLYRLGNMKYNGIAVYTNKAPACAMQGYGAPQITFGVETTMGMLAEKLKLDPLEIRLKNYVGLGETFWGQGPTVKSTIHSDGVRELIDKGSELIGWENRPKSCNRKGRYRRGIGMSRGFHTSGTGAPVPGEVKDYTTAMVKINEDGTVDLLTALMDHGGGTLDAAAKLVAEELGVPFEKVGVSPADTRSTGYDVCTHATRGVYCGGGAAYKVAKIAKQVLLEYASRILNASVNALRTRPDLNRNEGVVYVDGMPEKNITIAEVARTAMNNDWGTAIAVKSIRMVNCPPAYTVYFVEVEVDMETGYVKIVRVVAGSDAGVVINPVLARGQLHGGFYRGAGMALLEDTDYDIETGMLTNNGLLTDYKMLGAEDLPDPENFKVIFADTYEPTGPMGAKGIGEAALNPVPAAVASAVQNATGIWFTKLPILPEDILEEVKTYKNG